MLVNDKRESRRQHFLGGNITRGCGFGFRPDILGHLSCLGDGTQVLLRFVQVAGLAGVPQPATGPQERSPGGRGEGEHTSQQQHNAGREDKPIDRNGSIHA